MSCTRCVKSFAASKVAQLRLMLSIPPRSESMAGVIILFVFTNSVATSVWMFNAWTPFIFILFDESNWHVGLMSCVNGVFEMCTAFLSGYLADSVFGPSKTLRMAVMMGFCTLCVVLIGIWSCKVWVLVLAQVCEGTYMGFSFTCLESVFAQCVKTGDRDRLYSVKFSFEAAGPIVGLLLSMALYVVVGDTWNRSVLQCVMTAGLLLHLCSMATFLYTFVPLPSHLDRKEGEESAAEAGAQPSAGTRREEYSGTGKAYDVTVTAYTEEHYENEDPRLQLDETDAGELPAITFLSSNAEKLNQARTAVLQSRSCRPHVHTRYEPSVCTALNEDGADGGAGSQVLNAHSFFSAGRHTSTRAPGDGRESTAADADANAGSAGENFSSDWNHDAGREDGGVADLECSGPVRYVDVELENARGLRRAIMLLIPLTLYPLFVALADMILTIGSGMTTQYFGLFMMKLYLVSPLLLCFLNLCNSCIISVMAIVSGTMGKRYGRVRAMLPPKVTGALILLYMALSRGTVYGPKVLMCISYVVRNAFMNCSAGLSRALIMDLVKENDRGKWNALESIQSAGWSGTALIGGVLADRWGYGTAFIFTFFFHAFACTMLVPLTVRNDSRLPIAVHDGTAAGTQDVDERHAACVDGAPVPHAHTQCARTRNEKDTTGKDDGDGCTHIAALTVANVKRIASNVALEAESAGRDSAVESSDVSKSADELPSSHVPTAPQRSKMDSQQNQ